MKIQSLAVIFIIIVLPISLVLTSFIQSQIKTVSLQIQYDTKLDNATYDALKAFQLNTINSDTSNETDSKMRDIEASVNSFFHSIASNFNMAGYNKEILKEYVPALVYTMYDGYYIYSPYNNQLDGVYPTGINEDNMTYKNGERISGLKPYIFYSCRYKKGTSDFVITYSLDNYITIQGIINDNPVNDAGYLINNCSGIDGNNAIYRGINIKSENLKEYTQFNDTEKVYNKINDVKYYNEPGTDIWYSILNGQKLEEKNTGRYKLEDNSAVRYYSEAEKFRNRILNEYGLGNLKSTDAVFENGEKTQDGKTLAQKLGWAEYDIFKFDNNGVEIEEPNSDFNQHRLDVIRYSIEKNLSIAIANYNTYSTLKTDFQMPKLKEEEWDKILKNVSIISFMQGLNIGGKVYNGYSIINNTKNKEVVTEDSIYITAGEEYYRPIDIELKKTDAADFQGVLNLDFERKEYYTEAGEKRYFFPKKELGSYSSIVNQNNVFDLEANNTNIYDYMEKLALNGKSKISSAYFTALGRERQSKYRPNIYKK